ncbi:unnamed protein product [Meganyctiphanes norvegica]|uniref:Solute carrier family 43 member 3 n=1 Tax=Meganyctiphanes norvegica TaxID=48144 RepID=A0AAV2PK08_MEGNR
MALWLCRQPHNVEDMSLAHRIMIFLIGISESILWSGCIFGWPQLVQVLKMNGIYSHLCKTTVVGGTSIFNGTSEEQHQSIEYTGCSAQDERYALIYTVCCVLYSTPGIFIGYSLHHFGLAATRVAGGLMMTGGFLLLSAITIESPDYLWGGAILISVAGNTIRMAGLQFGNLFPQHCAAAMSVISGIFSVSAAVFVLFTYGTSLGLSWQNMCYIYAFVASLILVATLFVPVKHIPYKEGTVDNNDLDEESKKKMIEQDSVKQIMISGGKEGDTKKNKEISLSGSLFSLSNLLNIYWLFINLIGITIFATFFNSWINRIAENLEEAIYYSRLYGYANIFCVFFTFLPGFLIKIITKYLQKGLSGTRAHVAEVQALIIPMVLVTVTCTIQFSCLLLDHSWAIYLALICLAINRPACLGVGNPFTRLRFPADHFNRLLGIQGTLVSFFTLLQYAHFIWAQNHFYPAMITILALLIMGLSHPLHLLNKTYISNSLKHMYPS